MGRHRIRGKGEGVAFGFFLIGLGFVFLSVSLGWFHGDVFRRIWPLWPALFGVGALLRPNRPKDIGGGVFMLGVAAYLFISNEELFGLGWATSWPLVLVAAGLAQVASGIASRFWPAPPAEDQEESHA